MGKRFQDAKIANAHNSNSPMEGFHVSKIPSPYDSMLLILETSSPIHCSLLVPKPEGPGSDKAQREQE